MTTTDTPGTRPTPSSSVPERNEPLIRASNVSKRFTRHQRRATSLKERIVKREHGVKDDFWALRDIDLVVHRGETVGLTGPNGSGKSTLLKVLSGILRSSSGEVEVNGRVASLLELGAGFDGELTGRENVYLNSALLGVPKAETDRLFDEIVEFSELGEFIDNPVKHYSSGMYVRLGFSVAVHIDPDILIVDEVLSVGDAAFQNKCIDRIRLFQQQGKTILFVSHASGQITSLCTRAVLLNRGRILFDGPPKETVKRLNHLLGVDSVERRDEGAAQVSSAVLVDPSTSLTPEVFESGAEALFLATIDWLVPDELPKDTHLELSFASGDETVAVVQPQELPVPRDEPARSGGRSQVSWRLHSLPALAGDVTLRLVVQAGEHQLALAEVTGLRIHGDQVADVEGTAVISTAVADSPASTSA